MPLKKREPTTAALMIAAVKVTKDSETINNTARISKATGLAVVVDIAPAVDLDMVVEAPIALN
jgi:DNA primase